jgi:NADPH-dependent glutamate synthase beta subunit-like oxidoreductase/NAD-dependent dihydropyrimidine dehydrogenase PreA subunit
MEQQYLEHDLSISQGLAYTPRDFHWLEKSVPCQHACPARTDIPGYLGAISAGELEQAYRINLRDNVFPAILGRICTRPCEQVCRHGYKGLGDPVAICFSKRSAADFSSFDFQVLPSMFPQSGKNVAVIGAGPAGLAVARDLCLMGHTVNVYEQHHTAGGMLVQNIPPFRLPREIVAKEVKQIEKQGVQIHCNIRVGQDVTFHDLKKNNDALIIAGGCTSPTIPRIRGWDSKGVLHGSEFLRAVIEKEKNVVGRRVIVIGGGFTAVDCARGALRCGAESVTIYYRRQQKDMTLTPGEFDAMSEEGIISRFLVSPREVLVHNGRIQAVQFVCNRVCTESDTQKSIIKAVTGSEFEVQADTLLLATGQGPDWGWLEDIQTKSGTTGTWRINLNCLPYTSVERLFIAGDQGHGSTSVITAVASGRQCARAVDSYLMGQDRLQPVVSVTAGRDQQREMEYNQIPRQKMTSLAIVQRTFHSEVEQGFTADVAEQETKRCYLCHYKYEIDPSRCIFCDLCCEVKPQSDCILKVQGLERDGQHRIHGYLFPADNYAPDNQFVYRVNPVACIRCNRCLEVCPVNCIEVHKVILEYIPKT